MSNYLYIVAEKRIAAGVEKWIAADSAPDEVHRQTLPSGQMVFFVARGIEHAARDPANIMTGWAMDSQSRTLSFGYAPEMQQADEHPEGCFFLARRQEGRIRLNADAFGQVQMLHFSARGIVAVSGSLFALTELRRLVGLPCIINETDALARSWSNGITNQVLSDRTLIKGVSYSPPGTTLEIDVSSPLPVLTVRNRTSGNLFGAAAGAVDYREALIGGASRIADLVSTLIHLSNRPVNVDVSGGLDSRTVLAAAHVAAAGRNSLALISNAGRQEEYAIARTLAQELGTNLGGASKENHETERIDRCAGWFIGCAGLYDPLHSPGARNISSANFGLGGHGAEVYKGNYGWRTLARIASFRKDAGAEAFRLETERGLKVLGVAPDHPWGSEWHYLGYRNSVHSGRSTMTTHLRFRPLLCKNLVAATYAPSNPWPAPCKENPSLMTDLLIALSPELAVLPFDDSRKNLSKSFVAKRSAQLGPINMQGPFDVKGRPEHAIGGTPALFIALAAQRKLTGPLKAERVRCLAKRGWASVPASLKPSHQDLFNLSQTVTDPVLASTQPSVAAGKLMKFILAE